jgi:hypothetical protein
VCGPRTRYALHVGGALTPAEKAKQLELSPRKPHISVSIRVLAGQGRDRAGEREEPCPACYLGRMREERTAEKNKTEGQVSPGSINGEGDTCGVQAQTETHTKLREVERAVEAAVQSLSYGAHVPRIRVARAAAHGLNLPETNLFKGEYALPGGGDVRNVRKRRPPRRAMQHLQR